MFTYRLSAKRTVWAALRKISIRAHSWFNWFIRSVSKTESRLLPTVQRVRKATPALQRKQPFAARNYGQLPVLK